MTREELREHCKKQIENCEMWARCKGEEPHGKVYEEHRLILELLEQESKTWSLDDAREDFVSDVYNTLDFLPTNEEANRIIGSFDRVTSSIKQEPRWIPVSERLPEEHEWIGTKTFGTTISDEVYVTFESPEGERFTEHLSFQNGKVSNFVQREIDAFHKGSVPVAWMPLSKPYEPQESEE